MKFVWLEDMYVTGVLAESVGLSYIDNAPHHVRQYSRESRKMKKVADDKRVYLLGEVFTVTDVYKYWKDVQKYAEREA